MASQILQDIPSVIPLFPLDGTSYGPTQRIQVEIPPSIQVFTPSECYLSMDVTFPEINLAQTAGIVDWTTSADPAISDSGLVYLNAPQTWGNAGAHGMIRDLAVYSMGTGQEVDRINYYNVACRGLLPFLHGKDESCMVSQEQGLNLWKPDVMNPRAINRLNTQLTEACHPFDLQYNHQVNAPASVNAITGSIPRTQRYSLPFRFGFLNSPNEYVNLGGLRIDMLLDTPQRCLEFYNTAVPSNYATIGTVVPAAPPAFTSLTTTLSDDNMLGLANQFPVGSVIAVSNGVSTRYAIVTGYSIAGGFVVISHTSINNLAGGAGTIVYQKPTAFSRMSFTVNNVALYVRQTATGPDAMSMVQQQLESDVNQSGYSFRSLYNYPLQIVANQNNPVLNYNIVPLKFAQGLVFVPTCDSDLGNISASFPSRLSTLLLSGSTPVPANQPNKIQYQVKLGNDYLPLQPTNIDQLVPQILSKEMSSFIEVCLEKEMVTAQPLTLDSLNSVANQLESGIVQYYNRPLASVLVPNADSSMDISTKNIQLLIFSNTAVADASQYTIYLFASHFKHLSLSKMGVMVDY